MDGTLDLFVHSLSDFGPNGRATFGLFSIFSAMCNASRLTSPSQWFGSYMSHDGWAVSLLSLTVAMRCLIPSWSDVAGQMSRCRYSMSCLEKNERGYNLVTLLGYLGLRWARGKLYPLVVYIKGLLVANL